MKNINIFCFGFGQVAKNFINKINLEKININLSTTSTAKTELKKFGNIKYMNYRFRDSFFDDKLIEKLKASDYLLVSIPPINGKDLVIENFKEVFKKCDFKWLTYLSATSVYGDHKGKWVNELSSTKPTSNNGIDRLKSELSWLEISNKNKIPLQIFRLSGIYSDKNNILVRLKNGKANIIKKKNQFFSRIHLDDIGNILFKSLFNFRSGEIFNISDDKPASSEEVILHGIKILNIDKPKILEVQNIKSEMLKNFYKDSKKVDNKKMKHFFKYNLKYPSYIEGLDYIFHDIF